MIALVPGGACWAGGTGFLGSGGLEALALVRFVGILSVPCSPFCTATPVLAGLKEREPQYKQLAARVARRAAGGRPAQRAARAGTAGVAGRDPHTTDARGPRPAAQPPAHDFHGAAADGHPAASRPPAPRAPRS